ncbi:hypothetical protein AB0B66_07375 [Catellatospora sp. NPDC049111]|uniref:hypothetical protein n=1 Tax=Catellatospora sp. NPDC049111 TaxID=3155271 RepID=UPI0033D0EA1B
MRIVPSGEEPDHVARHQERVLVKLADSGLPLLVLDDPGLLTEGRLAGFERSGDRITCVRVVYGDRLADEPWVSVETARWAGTRVEAGPLRSVVEHGLRAYGERFSAVDWSEADTTVLVDGRPLPGRIVRAGSRWWAARCADDDVEITVLALDWHPEVPRVRTVTDIALLMTPSRTRPSAMRESAPEQPDEVPASLSGEPHRALVEIALRMGRDRARWMDDGGPGPQLPTYWRVLWRRAVRRQMALADQPEPTADRAVSAILAQLTSLQDRAGWFRDDAELRERAIAESLLFGTGLGESVSSAAAQRAWLHREETIRRTELPVEVRASAEDSWFAAWSAWAAGHTPAPPAV